MSLLFFFHHVLIEATRVGRYHYTPPHLHTHFLDTVVSFRTNVQQQHHLIADNVCSFFLFTNIKVHTKIYLFVLLFFFSSFHQLLSNQATNKASSGSSHKTTASSRKKERENVITAVLRHKLYVLPRRLEKKKIRFFVGMIMTRPRRVRWSGGDSSESKATSRNNPRCTHRHAVRATLPTQKFCCSHHCTRLTTSTGICCREMEKICTRTSFVKFSLAGRLAVKSNGNGTVPSRRSLCRSGVRFQPPMATGMPARCQLKPSVQHLGYSLSLALDSVSLFSFSTTFFLYHLFLV